MLLGAVSSFAFFFVIQVRNEAYTAYISGQVDIWSL